MARVHKNVDIVNGPMAPGVLSFVLPLIAANILQRLFNAADVVVVGRFVGDNALAAVTSTTALIDLLINLFTGLAIGANVVAARALGAGDHAIVRRTVHTSITLSLLCGFGMMCVGLLFSPTLLRMMASPEEIIGQSTLYLRLYFLGVPFQLLYNFGSALLRAGGDTRRPMLYLTAAGVLNAILNLILVVGFRLSVAGVGIATAASHIVSGSLVLRALIKETGPLHLDLRRLRMDGKSAGGILQIGLPAAIQSIMINISNVTVQSSVNSLGPVVMAGSGAASSIEGLPYSATAAFYQAGLTFTGQNLGAKKPERIDSAFRWSLLMVTVAALITGGICCLFSRQLLGVYLHTPEAIAAGRLRIFTVAPFYFIAGLYDVIIGELRGMGASLRSMLTSVNTMCLFRMVWIFTVFRANPSTTTLFILYPITWALTAIAQGVNLYFVRRKTFARLRQEAAEAQQAQEGSV